MAGRPGAPRTILPPNRPVLNGVQVGDFELSLKDLHIMVTNDLDECIRWCAEVGLLANSKTCVQCQQAMGLCNAEDACDRKEWKCSGCNRRRSIRDGSFFTKSKLELTTLVELMKWWSMDVKQVDNLRFENTASSDAVVFALSQSLSLAPSCFFFTTGREPLDLNSTCIIFAYTRYRTDCCCCFDCLLFRSGILFTCIACLHVALTNFGCSQHSLLVGTSLTWI